MADQTTNRVPNRLGPPEGTLIAEPVGPLGLNTQCPNTLIYAGSLCGYNTLGQIDNIDSIVSTIVSVAGVSESYTSTITATPFSAFSPDGVKLQKGALSFLNDGSISGTTPYGADLYAVDNQTLSANDTSATGAARVRAGFFECLDPSNTSNVICQVGQASPLATAASGVKYATPQNKAAYVFTSLGACTGTGTGQLTVTATGVFGAQDTNATPALGDVVLLPEGLTNLPAAKDAGPYVITTLGAVGVSGVLTRPDWWVNGSVMPYDATVDIGPIGAIWAGTSWRSFAAVGSAVVGTNAPAMYPGRVVLPITLAASTFTISGQSGVPLRSATKSSVTCQLTGGTPIAATVGYGTIAAPTPGAIGTSSITVVAIASGMGKNGTTDAATLNVLIVNW